MEVDVPILAIALIVILAGDTIACAIPIDYIRNDLNRLNVSAQTQRIIPVVKGLAVVGLVFGLWIPMIGLLAAVGLVAYFMCALGVHKREDDEAIRYVAAVGFLVFVLAALIVSYA